MDSQVHAGNLNMGVKKQCCFHPELLREMIIMGLRGRERIR